MEAGRRRLRPRAEPKVRKPREASGNGSLVRATGMGVACNDSHACRENWRAVSRRPERIEGRFFETQEMKPPGAPA